LTIAGQRNLSLIKDAILATQAEIRTANRPIKIHVLGTGNPHILPFYVEQGIDSFDSSTWLRKAWLDNRYNYFEVSDNRHKAHRATRIGLGPLDPDSLEWATSITCPCPFCQDLGQQILLFRGHERNTRRGFHNVYQYIRLLNAQRR
jgi:tRNA-guanine family transglycosylase